MAIRIAPFTFSASRTMVRTRPIRNTQNCGWFKVARAGTPLSKVMIPTFRSPIYATNIPMPPPMACCRLSGMDLIMYLRILVAVIKILKRPQMNYKCSDDRSDDGSQKNCAPFHSGLRKYSRIDNNDVRHGEECRKTGHDFC